MNYQSVNIVIPTFNGKELLGRFLPLVMKAAESYKGESEIIIVDDGGTDGSDEFIRRNFPEVRLIKLDKNKGFAWACNEGFRVCKNEIVILLNNDVLVADNFISPLIPHFNDKDVFGVRPGLSLLNKNINQEDLDKFSIGLEFKTGFIELPMVKLKAIPERNFIFLLGGTSSAFDKDKLLKLGGFDEMFKPFYWEDADLSYRAWKRGWKIIYEPKSLVYHQTHSTIFKVYPKHYIERISEKNKYILVWKNISDKKLLFYHFSWIPFRLLGLLIRGKWHRLPSLFLALRELGKIREKRKFELQRAKVSDAQIFNLFSKITKGGIKLHE